MASKPRVFTIPASAPFLPTLITALTEGAPDLMAMVRVGPGVSGSEAGPLWSEVLAADGDGSADA